MPRIVFGACILLSAAAVGLKGRLPGTFDRATASELPPPGADSRPPGTPPELPRVAVELPTGPATGPVRVLSAGEDLQAALEAAIPGDVIAIDPAAVVTGPIRLPAKSGNDWITIRTRVPDGAFPPPGTRVGPSHASLMPKIEASSGSAITAAAGAHHYRFIGLEIRSQAGAFLKNLVELGASERSVDALPHHIVFERCYLHGDPSVGGRRGVAMNSRHTAVIDSYLADFKEQGADAQAIAGWNGLGPFAIVNSYLEAAGENVLFGGADPAIANLVPSDIEVRSNHFSKPLSWKIGEPAYNGIPWTVKNLFELKNARRVLVNGNLFEHNWPHGQSGFAILFTVRNQDGRAPWSTVEDVTFSNNTVRHVAGGFNILGRDNNYPSQQTRRILIRNNLFVDVGGERWGANGRLFQLLSGVADVTIDHNTAFQTGVILLAEGAPNEGFVYHNNITPHNEYGMIGANRAPGNSTLATYFPGATIARNVIVGGRPELYPPGNFFPAAIDDVGFVNRAAGDYRLAKSSPYTSAGTDGKDLGVVFSEFFALGPTLLPGVEQPRLEREPRR